MSFTHVFRHIGFRRAPLLVAAMLTSFFAAGCGPDAALAPTAFTAYTAPDKSFVCQAPNGWKKVESAAAGIMSGVSMTQGNAKVYIASDLMGSLTADIAAAQNAQASNVEGMLPPGMEMPKPVPPVEKLHIANKKGLSEKYKDYQENQMQVLTAAIGEGRFSEFTGDAGFFSGGKMRGYRATALSGERSITAYCVCSEKDFDTLKPAFQIILSSIGNGGG